MRKFDRICFFFREENGQTTTEYVLMIAIVLGVALLVIRDLVQPVMKFVSEQIEKRIDSSLFKPGSFHRMSF